MVGADRGRMDSASLDELEGRLRQRLDALPPAACAELLHVLVLPDFDRAGRIGEFYGNAQTRSFAELLIDCERGPGAPGGTCGDAAGRLSVPWSPGAPRSALCLGDSRAQQGDRSDRHDQADNRKRRRWGTKGPDEANARTRGEVAEALSCGEKAEGRAPEDRRERRPQPRRARPSLLRRSQPRQGRKREAGWGCLDQSPRIGGRRAGTLQRWPSGWLPHRTDHSRDRRAGS